MTSYSTTEPSKPIPVEIPNFPESLTVIDTAKHLEPVVTLDKQITKSFTTSTDGQVSQSITSKTEISKVIETSVKQESKTFTLERKTPTIPDLTIRAEPEPFPVFREVKKEEEITIPVQTQEEETGIQTTSISKQSSYDFFVKKLKESEEPPPLKEVSKPIPIKQEVYTKFEDISRNKETKREEKMQPIPKLEPLPKYDQMPKFEPPKLESTFSSQTTQQYSFSSSQSQQQMKQEFNLTPEPPPEICYVPKMELTKTREEVVERKKKLEQAHRDLSAAEIPSGGVKIFPTPISKFPEVSKFEPHKPSEITKFEPFKPIEIPKLEPYKHIEAPKYEIPKQIDVPKFEPFKHVESIKYESSKQTEIPTKIPTRLIEQEVQLPPKEYAPIVQPQSFYEKKIFTESKINQFQQQTLPVYRQHIQTRPLSPKPSAEALKMEKLWTPQKEHEVMERPISALSSHSVEKHTITRPLSAMSTCSTEPRLEGLVMEKSWAHKSSESHITHKSWPPPQPEAAKVHPTWSTQSTMEKKWTPSMTKETIVKEDRFVEKEPYVSSFKETKIVTQAPVPHYVAKVSRLHEEQYMQTSQTSYKQEMTSKSEHILQENNVRPSEIIKSWPPQKEPEPTTMPMRYVPPLAETLKIRPPSVQDITDEVYLEPGPPPEIGFAKPPPRERRQSYVETVEQEIEKELAKEPSKVPPGAVRTIPPPLPPKKEFQQAPPLPAKPAKFSEPKKLVDLPSKPFERFPDLEPFPFKPEPERPKPPRTGPPPTPSKFIKGRFTDSDYESDFESVRIPAKWKPYSSDTDEPSFRRVQAPRMTSGMRSRSTEKEPLAPSQFERPAPPKGDMRPVIDFREEAQLLKKEQVKKYSKHVQKSQQQEKSPVLGRKSPVQVIKSPVPSRKSPSLVIKSPVLGRKSPPHARKSPPTIRKYPTSQQARKQPSPPPLKPGSPPVFIQVEKKKPESPKAKHKVFQDGYMADTDEPFVIREQQKKYMTREERTETRQSYQSFTESQQRSFVQSKPTPPKVYQHKKHVTSATKKVGSYALSLVVLTFHLLHSPYLLFLF